MSVKYNVVERGNPSDPTAPRKYYPSAVADGRTTLRQIARRAADVSTVSIADTVAVIEALLSIIPDEIGNGRVVSLGEFGSFWVKFKTEAGATPKAVTSRNITGVIPRFIPGREFKINLKKLTFEKK